MHIPSFKMPTLRHVWQLIQRGDYAFSIDLQDAYLHIPIVKHHCHFSCFVWHNVPYQWKVLPFWLATAPRVLWPSPNLFCSFAITRVSVLLSTWMTSWSWFVLSGQVRGHICFCFPCLSHLGLHINFSKSDLHLSQTFCFLGLCWDTVHMSVSLPSDKLADIQ